MPNYANIDEETLVGRLNKLDQYSAEVNPEAQAFLGNLQRPAGASPLPIEAQKLAVGQNAMEQWNKGWAILSDLLTRKQDQAQFDKTFGLQERQLAQDKELALLAADTKAKQEEAALHPSIAQLQSGAKTKASEYLALLTDLNALGRSFEGAGGIVSDIFSSQSGPTAKLLGQRGAGGQTRADLNQFSAKVKNKTYGSALTDTEIKDANTWIPAEKRQESTNQKRIESIRKSKENELISLLRSNGVSEPEIQAYLQLANGGAGASSGVQDPMGIL